MNTKTAFKTISLTLLIMLACTAFFSFTFALIFPKTAAKFFYELGETNLSTRLYYMDYNKSKNINSLALALDLSIENDNAEAVINYAKEFFNHEKYDDYINALNFKNAQSSLTPLIKSTLINENNYYKNAYAKALIKNNKSSVAFDFACENLTYVEKIEDIGCYIFSLFLPQHLQYFSQISSSTSQSVGKDLENYFYQLYDFYNENLPLLNNENKPYFIALGNRIITVGGNVIKASQVISEDINTEDIIDKAYSVNLSLSEMIGGV